VRAKRVLLFAWVATLFFAGIEFAGGKLSHSLALIADSVHLVADAGALGLAFFASWIAAQPATRKMSYGYHRVEILAALINGAGLLTVAIFVAKEALQRFHNPSPVHPPLMLGIGIAGLVFNLAVAFLLNRAAKENVNVRSAFFHVLSDTLGSFGVVAAAVIVWKTGWSLADPVVSIAIALLVIGGAWQILRDVVEILLEATPSRVNIRQLEERLLSLSGVSEICDLHVWTISSGKEALSAHLGVHSSADWESLLKEVNSILSQEFGIQHTTIQFENPPAKPHLPHERHEFRP